MSTPFREIREELEALQADFPEDFEFEDNSDIFATYAKRAWLAGFREAKQRALRALKKLEAAAEELTKMDATKVGQARYLHSENFSTKELARLFGISTGNMRNILKRETWTHVPDFVPDQHAGK